MRVLCCSILLLSAVPLHSGAETTVNIEGKEIIYNGGLDREANEAVFGLFSRQDIKPTTLTITSRGGPIHLGLELGEWVHERGLNVKVYDLCFSSCANYVFPAGRKKYLGNNAVIGFHGGATSDSYNVSAIESTLQTVPEQERERLRAEMEDSLKSYINANSKREAKFYEKLGVSPKINTIGQSEPYKEFRKDYDGWVYSVEDMKTLGLMNVEIINDPRPTKLAHQPKVFTVKLAPESTLREPIGLPAGELNIK